MFRKSLAVAVILCAAPTVLSARTITVPSKDGAAPMKLVVPDNAKLTVHSDQTQQTPAGGNTKLSGNVSVEVVTSNATLTLTASELTISQ